MYYQQPQMTPYGMPPPSGMMPPGTYSYQQTTYGAPTMLTMQPAFPVQQTFVSPPTTYTQYSYGPQPMMQPMLQMQMQMPPQSGFGMPPPSYGPIMSPPTSTTYTMQYPASPAIQQHHTTTHVTTSSSSKQEEPVIPSHGSGPQMKGYQGKYMYPEQQRKRSKIKHHLLG